MTTLTDLIRRVRHRDRSVGQSIVELALVLPVILLILMVGLDFGRVFLGWVNLNNTARIAANFAATNATALTGTGPIHDNAIDRYEALIAADATAINCELPDPIPEPTYPGGTALGQLAHVAIDCDFGVITPIISNIMGSTVTITASSDFPIRNGIIAGVPAGGGGSVHAAFNVSPVSGEGSLATPLHVTYTDVSTGSPTSYQWDLNGDTVIDSTQVGNSPALLTFDFTVPGTYVAKLTVSNGTSTSSATQTITVNAPPGPVVAFVSNPVGGTVPLAVSFTNNSTGDAPLTYDWDFGDGSAHVSTKNTSHTYTTQGTFTVTLTVTDVNGLSNAGTATITVTPAVAQCTVPDFRGQNSGNNIQGQWNAAGFTTTVIFSPGRPPEYTINKQQLAKNSTQPCATAVQTVFDKP
jgi:PKD repeat protein